MAWDGCAASNRLSASTLPVVLKGSKVSVEEACNALTWIHLTMGLSSPVNSSNSGGLRKDASKAYHQEGLHSKRDPGAYSGGCCASGTLSDLHRAMVCLLVF